MNTNEILEALDQQIAQLKQARALLAETPEEVPATPATKVSTGKRRGRPKGSVNKKPEVAGPIAKRTRAPLSAEGKARSAAAQKARWAAQKKTSKTPAKKVAAKAGKKTVGSAKPVVKKIAAKVAKKTVTSAKKAVEVKSAAAPASEA